MLIGDVLLFHSPNNSKREYSQIYKYILRFKKGYINEWSSP